jgi:flagellar export protein FliJ
MAFRFPLASVLRFRQSVEQQEELELRKLHLEIAGVRRSIEQATMEIAIAQQARDTAMQQPLQAAHLQAMLRAADTAIERKKKLLATLQKLEDQRNEQMRRYQEAHRGRQMLSDLQTREQDEYELRQVKAQQKVLDDMFGARHQRG